MGAEESVSGKMRWGTKVRGPKLTVSRGGLTIIDVAANPKTGDDNLGRYRSCATNIGLKRGIHRISIQIVSPGRIFAGICTAALTSAGREGTRNAVFQIPGGWVLCIPSKYNPNDMNMWNAGKSSKSHLPGLRVGGRLDMLLNCDEGTLQFVIDGQSSPTFNVPVGVPLFPVVSFGGDMTKGAAVKLVQVQVIRMHCYRYS